MEIEQSHRGALLRSNQSLYAGLAAVLCIMLLLITLPSATTWWTTRLRDQRSEDITAFADARLTVEYDVQAMQAAVRGYVITRQPTFLETYQTIAAELPASLQRLETLAPEVDPTLVPQVTTVTERVVQWRQQGPEAWLRLLRENNLAGAVAEISTGRSQQRFDTMLEQLRLLNADIARIDRAIDAQIARVRQLETGLAIGLGVLGILAGGYLIHVFRGIARLTRAIEQERERAEQANEQVRQQLADVRRRNAQLRVLQRVASLAEMPLAAEVRAERLLTELAGALDADGGAIWQIDAADGALRVWHTYGRWTTSGSVDVPELVSHAMKTNTPQIGAATEPDESGTGVAHGILVLPLQGRAGSLGALLLTLPTPHDMRADDRDFYLALANHAGLVLDNAALYARLEREQQRLQVIFDQSPEGIVFAEAENGLIVLANQAARALLDAPLPIGEPLGPEIVARCYQANGEPYAPDNLPLQHALRDAPRIGVEVLIDHTNGRRVPLLFNCVPLHDATGILRGAVAIFQDLTRFREVERLKSDFVAMVSHELRTPLTAIQGCTQALLRSSIVRDPQRTQEFLEIIDAQSARLHDLIDNLLDLSQMEAGVLRLRKGPFQPSKLVRNVVRQMSERLPGLVVQAEMPQSLPTISADADRIEQVLLNLLDNARKFSPPGGLITIGVGVQPNALLFSVRDHGPGILPSDRERVFERFFQSTPPPDGVPGGTGLGLAICKSLVEAHGGHIWVDAAVQRGTQINFTLPRMLETADVKQPAAVFPGTLPPVLQTAHILIVDDEPAVRQMLVGALRNAGYTAHAVAEGQAALEYLASERPDLVLLDVMLPGQDGFAVLQQMRDWSDVLVLMLTASPEPDNVVRGLEIGADDYVTKPFSMDELLARVAALLRRRTQVLVPDAPAIYQNGSLTIDFGRRQVEVAGQPKELTPTEFRLLAVLAHRPGQVFTHAQLLQQVWGPEYEGESQYLWVHIGRLRQKIEVDPKQPRLVLTERGVGYRLAAPTSVGVQGVV